MNKVILLGNLARDPETRYTTAAEPLAVVRFAIAITRKNDREKTDFINCVAFGKTGENIAKFFTKGRKIAVVGSIQNSTYEKNGEKKTATNIIVEEFNFCDSKQTTAATATTATAAEQITSTIPDAVVVEDVDEEDLPF